jgi:hypothetical protein
MTKKQNYLLIAFLLVLWLLQSTVLRNNLYSDSETAVRWISDHNDRWIYMLRGEWLPKGGLPYRDVGSEYPQIPTYLFGLFFLLVPAGSDEQMTYFIHSSVFSLVMLILLYATIRLLYAMLPQRKWMAFLMLLPGTLYFTLNRYDILPAFLSLLSLWSLRKEKYTLSGVILGAAALSKWYPALFLPVFLSYRFAQTRKIDWKLASAFVLTCLVIVLPTLIGGGLEALLYPYRLHAERSMEQVALPVLVDLLLSFFGTRLPEAGFTVFLALQFLPALLSLFVKIERFEDVVRWTVIVTAAFIIFSRIYSPQWLLWVVPLYILVAENAMDTVIIVVYNLVTYVNFPLVVDTRSMFSTAYMIGGILTIAVLAAISAVCLRRARPHFAWNFIGLLFPNLLRQPSS